MTCIVGLVDNGTLYFGGDSIVVGSYHKIVNRDSKVFQRQGLLFGTCGSLRLQNLLQYRLEIPHYAGTHPMSYVVNELLEAVRACFKQNGFGRDNKGQEHFDGSFLLGFEQELYMVGSYYTISRSADPYCAIGVGKEYAYGSLSTTRQLGMEPIQRLHLALEAAACYNTDVLAPFSFVTSQERAYGE